MISFLRMHYILLFIYIQIKYIFFLFIHFIIKIIYIHLIKILIKIIHICLIMITIIKQHFHYVFNYVYMNIINALCYSFWNHQIFLHTFLDSETIIQRNNFTNMYELNRVVLFIHFSFFFYEHFKSLLKLLQILYV